MQRCAFTPYEGKKPYIFVSYAHKDSARVFPILEELDRRGYRVWYDDGIAPGSEWPENIAQHLDGCSLTLAFISPNSIASANCRREVTFALSKRKPFLGILLEKTEMSLGMEMQLSAQQCIMKYTYTSDEDFFRKVCSCPDLIPCLGQPKAAPVPVTAGAPAAPVVKPAAPAVENVPAGKPLDMKLIGIIAGAVAAVALILVLLLGGGGEDDPTLNTKPSGDTEPTYQQTEPTGTKPEGTEPEKTEPEETEPEETEPEETEPEETEPEETEPEDNTDEWNLSYSNQVITAKDVEYISKQKELEVLEITDCVIQKGAFDNLKLASTVDTVTIKNCSGPIDLTCISGVHNLVTFEVVNCELTQSGLASINSEMLNYVDISGNAGVTDLSVFAGCPNIEYMNFSNTGVASLAPLSGMSKLWTIEGNNTPVSDLTPICSLTELRELRMENCSIATQEERLYSIRLEVLDLSGNGLEDIDFLEYCTVLREVDLSYNELSFVSVLKKSAESLESLDLSGNSSIYSHNLTFLNQCAQMSKLQLDGLYLSDLNIVSELEGLTYLSVVDCYIDDISGLRNLTDLEYLNLSLNNVTDISVLAGINSYYFKLDLSFNDRLTDVSALNVRQHFTVLNLTNESLDPYKVPLLGGGNLIIAYHEAWSDPNCMNEENRGIFTFVDMVDCPMDKIIAMEKRFDEDRIRFLQNVDDYMNRLEELGIDCTYLRSTMES